MAEVARREAMGALAQALGEEARTASLSRRSRELLREAGDQSSARDGATLRERAAFANALANLAGQAEQARLDASDQARWQVTALAAAETRAERTGERRSSARRALATVIERREQDHGQRVAHKLQCTLPTPTHGAATPAHRSRRRN